MPPETDSNYTSGQLDGIAKGLAAETAAPKPSLQPTKIGETLALYNRTHRVGSLGECRVAARVSSEEEVEAGAHHRVDVDRVLEDGGRGRREHGVTVFDALTPEQRESLCARYPGDKALIWAERID